MRVSETKSFETLKELLENKNQGTEPTIVIYNGKIEEFKKKYSLDQELKEHIKFLHIDEIISCDTETAKQEFTNCNIILLEAEHKDETDLSTIAYILSRVNIKKLYIQYNNNEKIDELNEREKIHYFELYMQKKQEEEISEHLIGLYDIKVNTLILCKDIISFRYTHPEFYALISKEAKEAKEAKKPKVLFRFLTDINFSQSTDKAINNLCITERKTKDEMINILEKVCNKTKSTLINSITFIDENSGNIEHLKTIEEIERYLKYLQSVDAIEAGDIDQTSPEQNRTHEVFFSKDFTPYGSDNKESDVLAYNPPDPLVEQFPPYEDFTTSRSHTQLPDLNTIEEDIKTEESRAEKIKRLISSHPYDNSTTSLARKQKTLGRGNPEQQVNELANKIKIEDTKQTFHVEETNKEEYESDSEQSNIEPYMPPDPLEKNSASEGFKTDKSDSKRSFDSTKPEDKKAQKRQKIDSKDDHISFASQMDTQNCTQSLWTVR